MCTFLNPRHDMITSLVSCVCVFFSFYRVFVQKPGTAAQLSSSLWLSHAASCSILLLLLVRCHCYLRAVLCLSYMYWYVFHAAICPAHSFYVPGIILQYRFICVLGSDVYATQCFIWLSVKSNPFSLTLQFQWMTSK